MLTILLSLLLTFSFKLVQLLLQIGKLNKKFTVIYWAIFIIAISPFFTDSYIYQLPKQMDSASCFFAHMRCRDCYFTVLRILSYR